MAMFTNTNRLMYLQSRYLGLNKKELVNLNNIWPMDHVLYYIWYLEHVLYYIWYLEQVLYYIWHQEQVLYFT